MNLRNQTEVDNTRAKLALLETRYEVLRKESSDDEELREVTMSIAEAIHQSVQGRNCALRGSSRRPTMSGRRAAREPTLASGQMWRRQGANTFTRLPQHIDAPQESLPFGIAHRGRVNATGAGVADDRGKRDRDAVVGVVRADRQHDLLVAENRFGDPRRYDADAELAGVVAFDDRDVGKADVALDRRAEFVERSTRGEARSATGAPHTRALDHSMTSLVPCSPTTSASTDDGLTPSRSAR